jgi:uncharacterized membrane protein YeaQ/YmgE (transglycosylase-associated protein family)
MINTLVVWIVVGLVVGVIARLLRHGSDTMGMSATVSLGILGALVGGGIAFALHWANSPYAPGGWLLAIAGAVLALTVTAYGTRTRRV